MISKKIKPYAHKVAIYTSVVNDYDYVLSPVLLPKGIDYFCFTDNPRHFCRSIKFLPLAHPKDITLPNLINRYHKFFPHLVLPKDVDYSIYVDGNIRIIGDIIPLLDDFINSGKTMGLLRHPQRSNIKNEILKCIELSKFADPKIAFKQYENYFKDGFDDSFGLTENNVILRRHNNEMIQSMDFWWQQMVLYSERDQVSLPYVRYKTKIDTKIYEFNVREDNGIFWIYKHVKGSKKRIIKVIYDSITFNRFLFSKFPCGVILRVLYQVLVRLLDRINKKRIKTNPRSKSLY